MKIKLTLFDFNFDTESNKDKKTNKKSSKTHQILETLFIGIATSIVFELLKFLLNLILSL